MSINAPPRSIGISSIIGILLIVALTVTLISFTAFMVFNTTDEIHNTPQATITLSGDELTLIRSHNVDKIIVREGGVPDYELNIGDTYQIEGEYQLSVIGILNGQKTLIKSKSGTQISSRNNVEPDNLEEIFQDLDGDGTSGNPYIITNDYELQAMEQEPDANYRLGNNIDAAGTPNWNDNRGFTPITNFEGSLNGDSYDIIGLKINRPVESNVGLIREAEGEIYDIGIVNSEIIGDENVGSLVGRNTNHITISNTSSTGNVIGNTNVGGIVGLNHNHGDIENSYSDYEIRGDINVGGLVGKNNNHANINNSYSNSSILGNDYVGGLVGHNNNQGNVDKSYVSGQITGDTNVGGLIGNDAGTIRNSYWDMESTGQSDNVGGEGLWTEEMQGDEYNSNFKTNIIDNDAFIGRKDDYPILEWQEK